MTCYTYFDYFVVSLHSSFLCSTTCKKKRNYLYNVYGDEYLYDYSHIYMLSI